MQTEFDFDGPAEPTDAEPSEGRRQPGPPPAPASPELAPPARLLFKPEEAAAMLGIGRTTFYELLAAGAIESVHIGSCRRVPMVALEDYVAGLRASQGHWTHADARRAARDARRAGAPRRAEHPVASLRPVGDPEPTAAREPGA